MNVDLSGVYPFITDVELQEWFKKADAALETLKNELGFGAEMTGWSRPAELSSVPGECKEVAAGLRSLADICVVIGIGGSYLGAKAVSELLGGYSADISSRLIFVGNTLSGAYYERVLKILENRDFCVVVISKSGTTTEPAVAFRIFERLLKERYGANASKRITAITNPNSGALRQIAASGGYTVLTIPDNIGGRYSVLTAAGLLPLEFAGVDSAALLSGATEFAETPGELATAVTYAAVRQALYSSNRKLEVVSVWEPNLRWFGEWYKQLFGESEGKGGGGIFPVSLELTADLHSMGQYMQDGERLMFETFLWAAPTADITVPRSADNFDGFNNLAGRTLDDINRIALNATKAAHIEGGVPAIELSSPTITPNSTGKLLQFFMTACAVSGYVQGVNPFDQPGVEAYKLKMKQLM